MLKDRAIL